MDDVGSPADRNHDDLLASVTPAASGDDQKSLDQVSQPNGNMPPSTMQKKRKQRCRFFNTKKGCRAGACCHFVHALVPPQDGQYSTAKGKTLSHDAQQQRRQLMMDTAGKQVDDSNNETDSQSVTDSNFKASQPTADASRVVQRPVPKQQLQNPRDFQISQIKKRFAAQQEVNTKDGHLLHFNMTPSDPGFPFEIAALQCILNVPGAFPAERPTLRVSNAEMERGYQVNVENGFDIIWSQATAPTLLKTMNQLDKQLETILTSKKADLIKIVPNAGPSTIGVAASASSIVQGQSMVVSQPETHETRPQLPSSARIAQAKVRRQAETQVLQSRLGRHPLFSQGGDGTMYTIPLEPYKKKDLPIALQPVNSVRLLVPLLYDIDSCSVELLGVDPGAAENVEKSFSKRASERPDIPLMAQINYLAQNIHKMAVSSEQPGQASVKEAAPEQNRNQEKSQASEPTDTDRGHIIVIPRPPEWTNDADDVIDGSDESSSDQDSSGFDATDSDEAPHGEENSQSAPREKGIMISFPSLELYGIELLELISPSITIKCERCKDTMDVSNMKNNEKGDYTGIRSETCKKCTSALGVGYRKDIMHANSVRAGYLDLEGCTIVDLLPSGFTPTCAECSTPYTSGAGVVSVRGESTMAICRECHRKMTFRLPDVKFLHVGSAGVHAAHAGGLPRKKPNDKLGLVAGQELPRRGRCQHYGKSYRWFRFSCCAKVFACDRCHDAATDHPNEFATRMVCGFCSREQHYRPEDCGVCHSLLTGKAGSGFWEGGKGTRDKARMSRKDPRKYKRRGGTAVGKAKASK